MQKTDEYLCFHRKWFQKLLIRVVNRKGDQEAFDKDVANHLLHDELSSEFLKIFRFLHYTALSHSLFPETLSTNNCISGPYVDKIILDGLVV